MTAAPTPAPTLLMRRDARVGDVLILSPCGDAPRRATVKDVTSSHLYVTIDDDAAWTPLARGFTE